MAAGLASNVPQFRARSWVMKHKPHTDDESVQAMKSITNHESESEKGNKGTKPKDGTGQGDKSTLKSTTQFGTVDTFSTTFPVTTKTSAGENKYNSK